MKTQCQSQEAIQQQLDQMRQRIEALEQENQSLQEEKHQLEALLSTASKNTRSTILQVDQELRTVRLFTAENDLVKGDDLDKRLSEMVQYEGAEGFEELERAVLETGTVQRREVQFALPDGLTTYMVLGEPLHNLTGDLVGLTMTATDISERQKAEQYLLEAEKLSAVGELAAGVAHEFKNVLAVIMGSGQLLQVKMKKNLDQFGEFLPRIEMIIDQSKKGTMVATDMLDMARPGKKARKFYDLGEVIDKVLELQKNQFRLEHIQIVRDYAEVPPVQINAEQLEQVFLNLSINARHAMKEDGAGTISIALREVERYVEVRFSDTGCGMSPEIQEQIFAPFFTTKVGEGSEIKGSGLGLSIISQTLKSYNGTIEVESEEGVGTTFIIRLPK